MEIKDLSWNNEKTTRFNNPLLPRSRRGLIASYHLQQRRTILGDPAQPTVPHRNADIAPGV